MKNKEIIARAAIRYGILSEVQVREMLEKGEDIPLHSLNRWNQSGHYKVKEGEEGITVKLWAKKQDGSFCFCKSTLYVKEQLEKVE